ncbi:hypothetical protein ET445_02440 [Agromyces protaetiae]|uniref:Uncharacterized protein n=1 Tax=Agromyces protaetiae TaxID=2509455 RepID=A0A4P6F9B5_9MICO|nr:hypothetical protein [Agromyces protaetiae]QAY72364.1 hypothetical protein ET445_02440 [Agromyces protaetiae]
MRLRHAAIWVLGALALAGFAAFDRVSAWTEEVQNEGFSLMPEGPTDEQIRFLAFRQMSYGFLTPALVLLVSLSLFALVVIGARAVAVWWAHGGEPEASVALEPEQALLGDPHDERARVDAEVAGDH